MRSRIRIRYVVHRYASYKVMKIVICLTFEISAVSSARETLFVAFDSHFDALADAYDARSQGLICTWKLEILRLFPSLLGGILRVIRGSLNSKSRIFVPRRMFLKQ